jgi:hypothetical protein
MSYDMTAALQALKDAPADTGGIKPEQWAVGVIEKVETRTNTFIDPPVEEINATVRLTDYDGVTKRGLEFLTIFAPPKGHPQFMEKGADGALTDRYNSRGNFKLGQFKRSLAAILAPEASSKQADAAIAAAAQAAGSIEAAMVGRTNLYHIIINDGRDKKGTIDPATGEVKIVSQTRADKPRPEIATVIVDTPAHRAKYNNAAIAAAKAAKAGAAPSVAAADGVDSY